MTRHVGGVHGPDGPSVDVLTNHLVLVVHDLPDEDSPDGRWYVDAGLGDALHEPLPLVPGTYQQGPLRFELEATDDGVGDWHLTHDPAGSFPGMSFRAEPREMDAFAERHQWLSTSPESGFVRVATAQARHAEGVDILRGRVLTLVRGGGDRPGPTTFERRDDWYAVLENQLGLRLDVGEDAASACGPRSRPTTSAGPPPRMPADRFLGKACRSGSGFRNLRCTPPAVRAVVLSRAGIWRTSTPRRSSQAPPADRTWRSWTAPHEAQRRTMPGAWR